MKFDARRPSKLPGGLVLAGAAAVVASTFLPWRTATPPLVVSLSEQALWLAGLAVVWGGTVGLVILGRESNIRLATLGILVARVSGFFIVSEVYSFVANEHTSAQLTLIPDIGPGPYMSVVGVIAMLIGSLIGFAKRRVAASRTPAQPEPALPAS